MVRGWMINNFKEKEPELWAVVSFKKVVYVILNYVIKGKQTNVYTVSILNMATGKDNNTTKRYGHTHSN